MKKINLLCLIAILIFFSTFVQAAPPTVSFTFNPTVPLVFQNVLFDPLIVSAKDLNTMYWGFGGDGNINYNRRYEYKNDLNDNFADGDLLNPYWDQNQGTWSVVSGQLNTASASAKINTITDFNAPNDLNFGFDVTLASGTFTYSVSDGNSFDVNGYEISGSTASSIQLLNRVDGIGNLIIDSGVLLTANVQARVFATRSSTGVWSLNVNSTNYTGILNPDRNVTHFHADWIRMSGGSNSNFDNINVQHIGLNPTTPIDLDKNETFTFLSAGKKVVCLTAGNSDGNTTSCQDVNVTGNIGFYVYDENTEAKINDAQVKFSGVTYGADSNGLISLGTGVETGDYTLEVFKTGYPSRYFTVHLDVNTGLQSNIYLLDENKGRTIEFLLRDTNTTKYPNRVFRIIRNNKIVSQVMSNSEAITTGLYLNNLTQDYNFFVDYNTGNTNIFSYRNTKVSVVNPANEVNLTSIPNFRIAISDLTTIDINTLNGTQNFFIYPNTYHPYKFTIDANTLSYFSRYYHLRGLGGQQNIALQPYMLRTIDNGFSAIMSITNSITKQKIPYYLVKFTTDLNSTANVLAEAQQSDTAGEFLFSTVTGKNYGLLIYNEKGDLVQTGSFLSNAKTTYYMDIVSGIISNVIGVGFADVNISYPQSNFLYLNPSNNYGFQFNLVSNQATVSSVVVSVTDPTGSLYSGTFSPTFPSSSFSNGQIFDVNFTGASNNSYVTLTITLNTSNGAYTKTYVYPVSATQNPTSINPSLEGIAGEVGVLGGFLIWFFVALLLSIGLRFNSSFGVDNSAMVFILLIWTGIAGYTGIINFTIALIAIMGGIAYFALNRRPVG